MGSIESAYLADERGSSERMDGQEMRLLVAGAGAIGSVLGGFLALAGHDVALLGRERHMEAIRAHGLVIEGIWGDHLVSNLSTFTDVGGLPQRNWDLVVVATKSHDVPEASRQILPCLSDKTLVLCIQNGLGNLEAVSEIVGAQRAVGGRVIFGVEVVEPGRVTITVYADKVMMGGRRGCVDYQRVKEIAEAFNQAGIPAEATEEIDKYIWGKVLYNCCLNALSALLEVNYGELLEHQETRQIMNEVIVEIFEVARKKGVALAWDSPSDYQDVLFGRLIPDTYAHRASMLQDMLRGKRTEIDAMNGAVARLGEQLEVSTPVNSLLTRLIKAKERVRRTGNGYPGPSVNLRVEPDDGVRRPVSG